MGKPRAQSPEQRREHVAAPPEHIVPSSSRVPARTSGRFNVWPRPALAGTASPSGLSGSWTRRDGRPGRSRWAAQCSALRSGGLSLSGGCKWAVWRPHWRRSQARLARPGVGGVEGGPHVQARALGPGPLWTRPSLGCRPCFLPSFLAIAMDAQPVAGRHLAQIFTVSRRLPLAGGGCVGSRRCGLGRAIQPWHRGGPRLPQWRRVARPVTAMST